MSYKNYFEGLIILKKKIGKVILELKQGDIASQADIKAVVNAANAQLKTGGGVAGAIHKNAGSELEKACRPLAPIEPGEAVITEGFNLPNDYVIHTLGPVYGQDKPEAELLARCYRNSLQLAEEKEIESVAFPAISTGAFGYPKKEASEIALITIHERASALENVGLIRFVLHFKQDYELHKEVLKSL